MSLQASFGRLAPTIRCFEAATPYGQGENIPGATLDLTRFTLDSAQGPTAFVYLNGRLLQGGSVNNFLDVYPGDDPRDGDIKINLLKGIQIGDVITTWGFGS